VAAQQGPIAWLAPSNATLQSEADIQERDWQNCLSSVFGVFLRGQQAIVEERKPCNTQLSHQRLPFGTAASIPLIHPRGA